MPHRVRRGTQGNGAKLTEDQIEEICALFSQAGSGRTWLARSFGVSRVTIWRHLKARGLI